MPHLLGMNAFVVIFFIQEYTWRSSSVQGMKFCNGNTSWSSIYDTIIELIG